MSIFADNVETIGHTPLVRIHCLTRGLKATVLAKIEGRNPAYSVKCRIGAAMIKDAEARGVLKPGVSVVEATSGNTGIALAFACAARGYSLTLTMPDSMSLERRTMLRIFGAQLVLTPAGEGMKGSIAKAEEIASQPGWFSPRQFENPANPAIHFTTTGPEIWHDTEGRIDAFVVGVGTGGTITGVGHFLKHECQHAVHVVAVEPAQSAVLSGGLSGRHRIQGIGPGFVPAILDHSVINEIQTVTDDEAFDMAHRLMREEGISCGISSGAAMAVALKVAARPEFSGKQIVTVLPDAAERYLSTDLFTEKTKTREEAHVCSLVDDCGDSLDLVESE